MNLKVHGIHEQAGEVLSDRQARKTHREGKQNYRSNPLRRVAGAASGTRWGQPNR
jgi:hypothetical protein